MTSSADPFPDLSSDSIHAGNGVHHLRNGTAGGAAGRNHQSLAMPDNQQIDWTLPVATPVGRALVSAGRRLRDAGCENPTLDAQVLLAHVLDRDRSWLFAHHDYPLSQSQVDAFTELVARRSFREPVAYLIGCREFFGLEFKVDRRVLIPRPETELLVDLSLAQLRNRSASRPVVVDVGTGSGAIAVTLAVHAPHARIYGLDVSQDALAVAKQNARQIAPPGQLIFEQSDMLQGLPEPADLIVANLPYVTTSEYRELTPDIRHYEPRLALEAGDRGLDAIERLLGQVDDHLKPDGVVLLEIGAHQGDAVLEMADAMIPQPAYVGVRRDYSGHVRVVTLEF